MNFSVSHERAELFPAYAFTDNKLQPCAGLQAILILFDGKKNNWGMAYWFAVANGYLGGERTQDILRAEPEMCCWQLRMNLAE